MSHIIVLTPWILQPKRSGYMYCSKDLIVDESQNSMSYFKDENSQMNVSDTHNAFHKGRKTTLQMNYAHFRGLKKDNFLLQLEIF